ncbi:MAG: hypothetical protein FJX47_05755 [Alphaproteobacteria bacterium]|nr:hypothetical protein [Alphaproteobacteria bacterium]
MELILVGLLLLCCVLAGVSTFAAMRLRGTVEATLRGGAEQTGTLRGDLTDTKKTILALDSKIDHINSKIAEQDRLIGTLRTRIDEVHAAVIPAQAQKPAG